MPEMAKNDQNTLNPAAPEFFPPNTIHHFISLLPPFPSYSPHHHLFSPSPPPSPIFPPPHTPSFPNTIYPLPSSCSQTFYATSATYCNNHHYPDPNFHPSVLRHHDPQPPPPPHPPPQPPKLHRNASFHHKRSNNQRRIMKSFWRRKLGFKKDFHRIDNIHNSEAAAASSSEMNGDETVDESGSRNADGVDDHCYEYSRRRWNDMVMVCKNKMKHPVLPVKKNGAKTTVMIRNIPNRYTREMLTAFLDHHCMVENEKARVKEEEEEGGGRGSNVVSAFDFIYLPIDFKNCVNKGYAFVNFTTARAAWKFYLAAHNLAWGVFQSKKICEVASARLQGKEELVKHFERIEFPCQQGNRDFLPVCFSPPRDGSSDEVINLRTVGKCVPAGTPR